MDHLSAFDQVPVNHELGFRLVDHSADACTVAMPASAKHVQAEGLIQGGILAALADTAAVYLLLPRLEPGKTCTSIEFKLNFLAAARTGGAELIARGRVVKRGRTIAVCAVDVEQAGVITATGLFTYLILDRAPVR